MISPEKSRIFVDVDLTLVDTDESKNGLFAYYLKNCEKFDHKSYVQDLIDHCLNYHLEFYFTFPTSFNPYSYWSQEDLYDKLQPIHAACKVLEFLHNQGYKICVLTAGDDSLTKKAWCYKHYPYIESYIQTNEKYLLPTENDIIIDDRLDYLVACICRNKFLLNTDYEQNKIAVLKANVDDDLVYVDTWGDILNKIVEMSEGSMGSKEEKDVD